MDNLNESTIKPLPGHFLAILDDSQMGNVAFKGDDKFDLPNSGKLVTINKEDQDRSYGETMTLGSLVGKRVFWAKYAESDCIIFDNDLQKDVVIISVEKLRGYE